MALKQSVPQLSLLTIHNIKLNAAADVALCPFTAGIPHQADYTEA